MFNLVNYWSFQTMQSVSITIGSWISNFCIKLLPHDIERWNSNTPFPISRQSRIYQALGILSGMNFRNTSWLLIILSQSEVYHLNVYTLVYLFSVQPYIEASKKVNGKRLAQQVTADEENLGMQNAEREKKPSLNRDCHLANQKIMWFTKQMKEV